MTNLQLLLSIGIPSILIVLSWLQQGARISRLETRTDKGFEEVQRQFVEVERKFDSFRGEMVALRDSIHRDMVAIHERVAVVETRQR